MHNFSAPTPIADLWKIARGWFPDALDAFGGPQTIQHTLDRISRRAIKRQLKALEALVMKLLLIEGAKLRPLAVAPQRASAVRRGRGRAASNADLNRPGTWRVCFQLHIPPEPPEPKNTGPRFRSLAPPRFIRAIVVDAKALAKTLAHMAAMRAKSTGEAREQASAERLARRFEALRRVFANPVPRARRLKQKLLALKRSAFAAAKRIAALKPPQRQLDPLLAERAEYAAQHAVPAFNSS